MIILIIATRVQFFIAVSYLLLQIEYSKIKTSDDKRFFAGKLIIDACLSSEADTFPTESRDIHSVFLYYYNILYFCSAERYSIS